MSIISHLRAAPVTSVLQFGSISLSMSYMLGSIGVISKWGIGSKTHLVATLFGSVMAGMAYFYDLFSSTKQHVLTQQSQGVQDEASKIRQETGDQKDIIERQISDREEEVEIVQAQKGQVQANNQTIQGALGITQATQTTIERTQRGVAITLQNIAAAIGTSSSSSSDGTEALQGLI